MRKLILVLPFVLAGCGSGSSSSTPSAQPGPIGAGCVTSLDRSTSEAKTDEERSAVLAARATLKCRASEAEAVAFARGGS